MLEAVLTQLESSQPATYLRFSRWPYAGLSGLHILGLAALLGSVIPLNLRLLGVWRSVPMVSATRILVPVAATGLLLAVLSGLLLFSVRATDYAELTVFQIKLALIIVGATAALGFHLRQGLTMETAPPAARYLHACVSLGCWLGALSCGRLIAFFT